MSNKADPLQLGQMLQQGLDGLGMVISQAGRDRLIKFLLLLERWNRTYNLTALRDPEQMLRRHLLESLALLPWLHGSKLLDMGSGAGLPGIPLAIARPGLDFRLIESVGKKVRFMNHVVRSLELTNVTVEQQRLEDLPPLREADILTARGLAGLGQICRWAEPLLAPGGSILCLKGPAIDQELDEVAGAFTVSSLESLAIPGLPASSHLVIIQRSQQEPGENALTSAEQ